MVADYVRYKFRLFFKSAAQQSGSLITDKALAIIITILKARNFPNTSSKWLIDKFDVKLFQHGLLLTADAASVCPYAVEHRA